jgi:ParB family chromosome partitioning protein
MRKEPHTEAHIKTLADSIHANGQIQNLVVEPELDDGGKPTGEFLVTVGEGRRLAQKLRLRRKQIKKDEPILCIIDREHDAREVSLTENVIRQPMHPADEFEAFKDLIEAGQSIEIVAARFGVTPLVVQRRLKLANVHADFIAKYRQREITLEHLMALAVTDNHERQQEVWDGLRQTGRDPNSLRRALTQHEVESDAAIALFVGTAYEKAGGYTRWDLFSEAHEGFLVDVDLLNRLATDKLGKVAAKVEEEGWAWVETAIQLDFATLSSYGRVQTILREPTKQEQAQLTAIAKKRAAVAAQAAAARDAEDALAEHKDRLDTLQAEEEALIDKRAVPHPELQACAGAIVSIGRDGKVRIERGLLKTEDAQRFERATKAEKPKASGVARTHSAALLRRLTAHRTLALEATLAQRPDIALAALTHRLVLRNFFESGMTRDSALQIEVRETPLREFASDLEGSKAYAALEAQRTSLSEGLPKDPDRLFAWLVARPQAEVLALLAFCVARTVDGVQDDEECRACDELAQASGLDMREWWTPTADGYLASLPKDRILAVVSEAVSPEVAAPLAKLKKAPLASAAEQRLVGTGWLPTILRGVTA